MLEGVPRLERIETNACVMKPHGSRALEGVPRLERIETYAIVPDRSFPIGLEGVPRLERIETLKVSAHGGRVNLVRRGSASRAD